MAARPDLNGDPGNVLSEFSEFVEPLKQRREIARQQIADLSAKLAVAREAEKMLDKAIAVFEPPEKKEQPKKQRDRTATARVSIETAEQLGEWLRRNRERFEEGFTTSDLYELRSEIGIDRSSASYSLYLNALADHAVIRLDHVTSKGGHVYKINEAAEVS